jgi:hypothetical protein
MTSKNGDNPFLIHHNVLLSVIYFTLSVTVFLSFGNLIYRYKYYSWIPAQVLIFINDIAYFVSLRKETNTDPVPDKQAFNFIILTTCLYFFKSIAILPGLLRFKYYITAIYFWVNIVVSSLVGLNIFLAVYYPDTD